MKNSDGRRYKRVSLNLPARIVINVVDEYEGRLINISPGDMALISDAKTVIGDAAVIHIKDLDVIEGTIARIFPDGVAVSYILSKKRRAILTEQLMLRTNPDYAEGLEDRRSAPRHQDHDSRMVCRLPDGSSLFVKIVNNSVDGVSVDSRRRPDIGASIYVGRQRGVVVRHTPRGFVVVYDSMRDEQAKVLRVV